MPMPVSRDRLHRPVDISSLLIGARRVGIMVDEPGLQRVGLYGNGRGGGGNGRGNNQQRAVVVARRGGDGGGGRRRRSQLPSWYPRTPLRDITAITRAIERRRAELGLNQNPEAPQEAQEEPEFVPSTPIPTISVKPKPSPSAALWRVKADHAGYTANDYENLTPQKKLLESIEKVREVWLEDQRKLQRTPMAKRAEREKKVRVLMSMR